MDMASHSMTRKGLFAGVLVAAAALFFVFASTPRAFAFPSVGGTQFGTQCDMCHTGGGTAPVVTLVSNDGTTATYSVAANGIEWAVFNGTTHVAGKENGSNNQFAVPVGSTYTIFDVLGDPGAGSSGKATVTPADGGGGGTTTTYTITSSAGANGAISPSTAQTVDSGSNVTYTITPNSGFHIDTLTVDGTAVTAGSTYTFTNVTANHTIAVTFAADAASSQYTLTSSVDGGHGSISPSLLATVDAHSSYSFRLQPDPGYHVDKILVDGNQVSPTLGGMLTFSDISANHSIIVSFAAGALPGSYALMPTIGSHGSVVPAVNGASFGSIITLAPHSTYCFRVKADLGYHVDTVLVDGKAKPLTAGGLITFSDLTASHTFAVTFAPNAATSLSVKASSTSLTHGKTVTLSSILKGGVSAGTKVTFQVKAPGSSTFTTVSSVGITASGAASVKYKLSKKGTYYFRVSFPGNTSFAPSTSSSIKVGSK